MSKQTSSKFSPEIHSRAVRLVLDHKHEHIPRQLFQEILRLIAELRPQPPPAPA